MTCMLLEKDLVGSLYGFGFGSFCIIAQRQTEFMVPQKKVAQCFVLNGVIFLGSILLLQYVLKPGTQWLLHLSLSSWAPEIVVASCNALIVAVYTWLWLFPAYSISLLVNCLW